MVKKVDAIQADGATNLVKKMTNTKIGEIEKKITDHDNTYITTQEVNVRKFAARLKETNLATNAEVLMIN